jgi:hypothetical protein
VDGGGGAVAFAGGGFSWSDRSFPVVGGDGDLLLSDVGGGGAVAFAGGGFSWSDRSFPVVGGDGDLLLSDVGGTVPGGGGFLVLVA